MAQPKEAGGKRHKEIIVDSLCLAPQPQIHLV